MRPRPAIVALCCALSLLLVAAFALRGGAGDPASGPAPAATELAEAAVVAPAGSSGAATGVDAAPTLGPLGGLPARVSDRALARAYAAVGAAELGDASALDRLDPEARERLDEARALLAAQPLITRAGAGAGAGSATGAPDQRGAASLARLRLRRERTAPRGGLVLDLAHAVDPHEALRSTPAGPVLVEPGLWAKAAFDPSAQRQLVVSDASGGGYAISVFAGDFSTVRVDGGLVVPGRYYLVGGSAVITGTVPCTVDIRPLSALGSYAPQPARPPQSNG